MRSVIVYALMFILFCAAPSFAEFDCTWNGIPLYGKVKIVNAFPDLKVKVVSVFPDSCGKWQFVEHFEDFTIQFVDSFPDLKIQFVESFPGKP